MRKRKKAMEATFKAENILKSNGLRKTQIRLEMLQIFMGSKHALSVNDIEKDLKSSHDRVTIYRALNSFEENGILHQTPDPNGNMRYAICSDSCPEHVHQDKHAHFICEECHQTYCLEDVKIPDVELENGYQLNSISYTMNGICKECQPA
ncbi:Fur family transcriptional regulator [Marivirga sp.]|uniref:Fur family transcriptional regulator n=1 Tax=Marivirga sp. TaxID=2018662 RepID=UPI0025D9722B|nr:Fur family transcriptional regulator [Marivirga sp.]